MSSPSSSPSRRQFLQTTAGALARPTAVVGTLEATGSTAVRASHVERKPAHVDLEFDRAFLETYQPCLDLSAVEQNPEDTHPSAMYAWKASSREHSTDVGVYWAEYDYQQGISPFGDDSHFGDHEPVYVLVDSSTGDVREVVYSAYHWLRGRTTLPPLYDETHPSLSVVSPWHQYSLGSVEGEFVAVESLGGDAGLADPETETTFEEWLSDEYFHDLFAPGVTVNPWTMLSRGHWWAEGRNGVSTNAVFVSSMLWASSVVPVVDIGGQVGFGEFGS